LEGGLDKVILVVLNNEIEEKIILQLKESGLDKKERIQLENATDFFRWLGIN